MPFHCFENSTPIRSYFIFIDNVWGSGCFSVTTQNSDPCRTAAKGSDDNLWEPLKSSTNGRVQASIAWQIGNTCMLHLAPAEAVVYKEIAHTDLCSYRLFSKILYCFTSWELSHGQHNASIGLKIRKQFKQGFMEPPELLEQNGLRLEILPHCVPQMLVLVHHFRTLSQKHRSSYVNINIMIPIL